MLPDARETLEHAFLNGISCPRKVSHHYSYTRISHGIAIEFHHFYIGFVSFIIALISDLPAIICGMTLSDGVPLYVN